MVSAKDLTINRWMESFSNGAQPRAFAAQRTSAHERDRPAAQTRTYVPTLSQVISALEAKHFARHLTIDRWMESLSNGSHLRGSASLQPDTVALLLDRYDEEVLASRRER